METRSGGERPIRILIADDHWVVREGLRMYLGRDPAFQVVGEADNGEKAIRLAAEHRPDVVLMDLLMPEVDGIEAIQAIRRDVPGVQIVALTSVLDDEQVVAAVRAGAIGYVLKDTHGLQLKEALRAAAQGRVHLAPSDSASSARTKSAPREPAARTAI
jgi:two-component system, NarL family, response regulator LiaR